MRCIWKSMKAWVVLGVGSSQASGPRGSQWANGKPVGQDPAAQQTHLLQHSLLRKVELLEPVILVIAGGVQVVGVHLGGWVSWALGPTGASEED